VDGKALCHHGCRGIQKKKKRVIFDPLAFASNAGSKKKKGEGKRILPRPRHGDGLYERKEGGDTVSAFVSCDEEREKGALYGERLGEEKQASLVDLLHHMPQRESRRKGCRDKFPIATSEREERSALKPRGRRIWREEKNVRSGASFVSAS